jgi:hypothetical protein
VVFTPAGTCALSDITGTAAPSSVIANAKVQAGMSGNSRYRSEAPRVIEALHALLKTMPGAETQKLAAPASDCGALW